MSEPGLRALPAGELWDARLEPLLTLTRGEWPEAVYRGVWVEADAEGRVLAAVGDPDVCLHLRSAAKPFQALALVESGAATALSFSGQELALACASHSGAPEQVALVEGLLARLGLSAADLECGSSSPLDRNEARRLERAGILGGPQYHMCSGKHAAMLALARHLGVDTAGYSQRAHPVQLLISATISRETGLCPDALFGGIDGCGVPVVRLPARAAARLYARLAAGSTPALAVLRDAMLAHPHLVAGAGRLDTRVMQRAAGAVVCKSGAGGVLGLGRVPAEGGGAGRGCIVKVAADPGHHMQALAAGTLEAWGLLDPARQVWPVGERSVLNGRGEEVGRVERVTSLGGGESGLTSGDVCADEVVCPPKGVRVSLEPVGPSLAAFLEREWPAAERESLGRTFPWTAEAVCVAARRERRVVGVAVGEMVGGVLEVGEVLVAASERRRGVGSALLAEVEAEAWRRGGHRVMVEVWAGSAAESFYRLKSYVRLALLPGHYQKGTQALWAKDRAHDDETRLLPGDLPV